MASTIVPVIGSVVSMAQLVVVGDAIKRYNAGWDDVPVGFPSAEVKNSLIFATITAVWGVTLCILVPCILSSYRSRGIIDVATPNILFFSCILNCISAILLTKGSVSGGACIDKSWTTCHLYTAALALEWVMCAVAGAGMAVASWLNVRYGGLPYPSMTYA